MSSNLSVPDPESNIEVETVIEADIYEDSDESDNIKYLKLELNQLRRENKHLRRRLEKYRAKLDVEKETKVKKQYAILKPEDPFVEVIKQLNATKQIFQALGGISRSSNFKIPTVEDVPKAYQSDILASRLESLESKQDSHKLTTMIDILQQQHNQRQEYTAQIEEFLQQVVDVMKLVTKMFTTRALKLRKGYNKLKSKTTLMKLQHQKYKMDINLILRDFGGHLNRKLQNPFSADNESITLSEPRPSFKMQESKKNRISIEFAPKLLQKKPNSPKKD